jgi:hypothetical protein
MCDPLFHELQKVAKRDSVIVHNVHVLFSSSMHGNADPSTAVEKARPLPLRALPPGDEGQALEEVHVLLVLEQRAVQRRD